MLWGMNLANKTAVVTGASRGIGRATVLSLAEAGSKVFAGARAVDELESLASEHPGITPLRLDVSDPTSVQEVCRSVLDAGPVDILVNNAGVGVFKTLEELSVEEWDRIFDVNVRGTFLMTKHLLPSIRKQKGHVVNVTSDVSARTFAKGSLYTASKYAQRALTRTLQMEVEADGVKVSEVRPGAVATYFADSEPQAVDKDALGPQDVADAILYALSRPERMRMDEIHFHPMGQKTEF